MCRVENAPCQKDASSSSKQPGRELREEKKLCKLSFSLMLINPGVLTHKIKRKKFNCNQLPRAPQKRSRGREGTGGTKHIRLLHHVHFCVFTSVCTSDDQVIGSQRISILRIQGSDALGLRTTHLDPRHILQAEGSSPFLPWLHPSSSAWQVQTCSHLLCMMAQKCHWACRCPQQGACPQRTYDPVAEKRLIWGEQPENNF